MSTSSLSVNDSNSQSQLSPERQAARARQLANLRPFPKGVSGNPGGKPKRRDISKAFERKLRRGAADRIADAAIATASDPDNAKQAAMLQIILDRVEGPVEQGDASAGVTINFGGDARPAWRDRALAPADASQHDIIDSAPAAPELTTSLPIDDSVNTTDTAPTPRGMRA